MQPLLIILLLLSVLTNVLLILLLLRSGQQNTAEDQTDEIARIVRDEVEAETEVLADQLRVMQGEVTRTTSASARDMGTLLAESQRQSQEAATARLDAIDRAGAARQRAANDALLAQLQVLETRLKNLEDTNANRLDGVRATLLQGMANIRADNNKKLDEIRGTVDEKLEATLQRRVSESFRAVSTQLEQVYKGLGEMQNLAADVGSLKQVLSGVKTRGILGEVQLGAILKEILAPGQYAENVATVPGSSNRVEYAVKLPGQSGTVWLPIDAKFPGDTYAHLQDAQASGDPAAVAAARRQLETVVRQEAKDIHDKYIEVPYTTAFGILFLPFEGLYAEVVNCGLPEILQRDYKINIAGPSTMAALLNALQMGFRTLAIQKRSGEVWQILGAVKTEFEKFGSGLQSMQRHLNQTGNDLEELIGTRSRAITRKLESVQQLEPTEAADLLGLAEGGSRISTQNSEIDRQDNAPRLRRKDDAGMPMCYNKDRRQVRPAWRSVHRPRLSTRRDCFYERDPLGTDFDAAGQHCAGHLPDHAAGCRHGCALFADWLADFAGRCCRCGQLRHLPARHLYDFAFAAGQRGGHYGGAVLHYTALHAGGDRGAYYLRIFDDSGHDQYPDRSQPQALGRHPVVGAADHRHCLCAAGCIRPVCAGRFHRADDAHCRYHAGIQRCG